MEKPRNLPSLPGIYIFKDQHNTILYVGKAKDIAKRVASYFTSTDDWKVNELLKTSHTVAHIVTKNETEALLLEAELIQKHQPPFNTLLKGGNPFLYIAFYSPKNSLPTLEIVRNKKKRGVYFGPFIYRSCARAVYRYLKKTFKLHLCNKNIENGCLEYHIGLCAGSCKKDFDTEAYCSRLELAKLILQKNHKNFLKKLHVTIKHHNARMEFEQAQELVTLAENFETIFNTIKTKFTPRKYASEVLHIVTTPSTTTAQEKEQALQDLQNLLQLPKKPRTIDCFDISHFQSQSLVGSCVRFTNGTPDKNKFRRFKIKYISRQNDYAALQEIVARRYKDGDWPDIILIDGGKGQRNSIVPLTCDIPCLSLAKREETLFSDNHPDGIILDLQEPLGRLLIALRNYAHHFAIEYHRTKRNKSFIQN